MSVVVLANNWVGWQCVRWLKEQGEDLAALVVHPPERATCRDEIIAAAELPANHVLDASRLAEIEVLEQLRDLLPSVGLSVYFGYILRRPFLDLFVNGVVNLHPSYLPFNRGAYPNVWSIIDATPAGVTLHFIDEGVDTGAILAQERVPVTPTDTGATLYRKLELSAVELLRSRWSDFRAGCLTPLSQSSAKGTLHRRADVARLDYIDLDRSYRASELIDLLRARTFPPHTGAYFIAGGRKVYLDLRLYEAEEECR